MSSSSSNSSRDTTYTKIFVGGLPYHTTDETLRKHFDIYGQIEEAVVITDRQTGKSRGYGFVTMADGQSAERACKDPNPIIDGRKANVNLAYLGAKPRTVQEALCLPIALKSGGLPAAISLGGAAHQYGLHQYGLYPTAYLQTAAGLVPVHVPSAAAQSAQTAALTAQTAQLQQYLDYHQHASAMPSLRLASSAATIDASNYAAALGGAAMTPAGASTTLMSPTAALYSYALSPQLLAAYQQQQQQQQLQLQDRM